MLAFGVRLDHAAAYACFLYALYGQTDSPPLDSACLCRDAPTPPSIATPASRAGPHPPSSVEAAGVVRLRGGSPNSYSSYVRKQRDGSRARNTHRSIKRTTRRRRDYTHLL